MKGNGTASRRCLSGSSSADTLAQTVTGTVLRADFPSCVILQARNLRRRGRLVRIVPAGGQDSDRDRLHTVTIGVLTHEIGIVIYGSGKSLNSNAIWCDIVFQFW